MLPDAAQSNGSREILVVDDDEAILALVVQILREDGYRISTASSVATARHLFGKCHHFGLLVTDLTLPDGSGSDLASEMFDGNASLAILFITGWTKELLTLPENIRTRAFLIEKPFSVSEFRISIHSLLPQTKAPVVP